MSIKDLQDKLNSLTKELEASMKSDEVQDIQRCVDIRIKLEDALLILQDLEESERREDREDQIEFETPDADPAEGRGWDYDQPLTPYGKSKDINIQKSIEQKKLNLKEVDGKLETTPITMGVTSRGRSEEDYMPTEEQLSMINKRLGLVDRTRANTRVFRFQSADTNLDRGYEKFSKKGLQALADLAIKNQIPFLTEGDEDHQWRQKNIHGVVYNAAEESGKLMYDVYIPVIPKTQPVLDAIFSGLYNKLSVGFSVGPEDYLCSGCKKSMLSMSCQHYPGMPDMTKQGEFYYALINGAADNYEISGVAVPMQSEAHIRRNSFIEADLIAKSFNNTIVTDGIITTLITLSDEKILDDKIVIGTTIEDNNSMTEFKAEPPTHLPVNDLVNPETLTAGAEAGNSGPPNATCYSLEEVGARVDDLTTSMKSLIEKVDSLVTQKVAAQEPATLPEPAAPITMAATAPAVDEDAILRTKELQAAYEKAVSEATEVAKASIEREKKLESLAESVDKLQKTVEVAMTGSLKSLMNLVLEKEEPATVGVSKTWVSDYFNREDLLGGQ